MSTIADVFLACGAMALAFTIGGNLYEQVICVPGWRAPGGLSAWRSFTGDRHAGHFFLVVAPASLIALAAGTALGWNEPVARNAYALCATVAVLVALVFTRLYFIPRNLLLFAPATATTDASKANKLLEQWVSANRVRVAIAMCGLVSAAIALRK